MEQKQHVLLKLWKEAWSLVLVELSRQELGWLFWTRGHLSLLTHRRTMMIVSRVRLVAGLFAILTPLWIVIDIAAFPQEVWLGLISARVIATIAFLALLLLPRQMHSISSAYQSLGLLLAIPSLFFLFSYQHMMRFELHGIQEAFAVGYAFLPFVMLAGLSIFPLTLLENIAFALPMLVVQVLAATLRWHVFDWPTSAASFWLLILIASVSAMAGLSQLAFIIVLVREAIRDNLTGCFSRRSGEELLGLQFRIALRASSDLAIAFLDIDHFKAVNDGYGHEAGDRVLKDTARAIRRHLRTGDTLIRWGGEEFVLIMPCTSAGDARIALERLREQGLGTRPDGTPITASIGIAERQADKAEDWQTLVAAADGRMYAAKQSGRDGIVG